MAEPRLSDLDFVDLYVCLEGNGTSHYHKQKTREDDGNDAEVPPEFKTAIDELRDYLKVKFVEDEMGFTYESVRMRGAKVRTAGGVLWAALRKINTIPPAVDKLGLPPPLVPHLKGLGRRQGLILICGSTGQGKTTTASSLLADYLSTLGGVAFTIEDPVEYDLEGRHNEHGFCYQTEVKEDHEWALLLKRSLRWHPRYIFVGEMRTPEAANQLLRAATSGHLVMTTMHSGSVEEALEGLLQLAEQAVGERATTLLASGLAAVMHQTILQQGLQLSYYITDPINPASPFRNVIRDKRIGQIRTFLDQQSSLVLRTGKLFREGGDN
ncbi:MAG: type IV pilus twitching motility protein PilT [Alphaproteobacteria bacterium]|nr:type IV pilus twitching motility protein PilT [Alphaproteobacteria bacterium]